MIGVDLRELTYLKTFDPICKYFIEHNVPYNVYYYDVGRGPKEYNRASPKNINLSSPHVIANAKVARKYSSNAELFNHFRKDGVKKFVGLELFMSYSDILENLRACGIKTYSVLYLSDSMWTMKSAAYNSIDRIYFTSKFLMDKALEYSGSKYNKSKHLFLGSPLFDQLKDIKEQDSLLVMLPNISQADVHSGFGSANNFITIMKNLGANNELIYKTRTKQWLPNEIKPLAKEIIVDGSKMYPSAIVDAFNKCNKIVMFGSSGIYEAVATGKSVINIPIPVSRWRWDQNKLRNYFIDSKLYNYSGAVLNLEQADILKGPVDFGEFTKKDNKAWIEKFIGKFDTNGANNIAKSIII